MAAYHLDCKGQRCPKPIVQISKKMRELAAGDTLEVVADDPAFAPDLEAWLAGGQASLMELHEAGASHCALLRRA